MTYGPEDIPRLRDLLAKLRSLSEDARAPLKERQRAWEKWHALNARLPRRAGSAAGYRDRPTGRQPSAGPTQAVSWGRTLGWWFFLVLLDLILRDIR
jgi:hypothetical protein